MPRHSFDRIARLGFSLLLAGTLACAHAAELGEPQVRTFRGQPLVADIELTALADPDQPVSVRLAHADVYRGASIAMHPILSNLNMSVMRRDGRQFLHITSTRPVESEHVTVFLDLGEGGRRQVRSAILFLAPDPTPPAPAVAPAARAPAVGSPDRELEAAVARAAMLAREQQQPRLRPQGAAPAPASCPQLSAEQAKSCAAIDYQNGLLSAQIVELEEKVKLLQAAVEGKKPAPVAVAAPPAAKPAAPPPAKPAAPKKPAGTNWLLIGGLAVAGLALLGGLVFFLLRRRKGKAADKTAEEAATASAAWYARLLARFKRQPKAEEQVHEEPKAE